MLKKAEEYYLRDPKAINKVAVGGLFVALLWTIASKKEKRKERTMALQKYFRKFDDEIKLTRWSEEYKDARTKEHSILNEIKQKFRENGYPVIEEFRQGSFATDTAIKKLEGDLDVDRAIVIKQENAPDDPVKCKKTILDVLGARGFKNAILKTPCVTADYAGLKLHIDYAVYSVDEFTRYAVALGKEHSKSENRIWQDSESKELINWLNGTNNSTSFWELTTEEVNQFKRLVRYLKRWRDYSYPDGHKDYIYSIGLAIMLKESFCSAINANGVEDDLESLIKTLDYILNRKSYFLSLGEEKYNIVVNIPFVPNIDIFRKHGKTVGTTFKKNLESLLKTLREVSETDSLIKQCELLNKVFGDDFEVPTSEVSDLKRNSSPGIVVPSQGA